MRAQWPWFIVTLMLTHAALGATSSTRPTSRPVSRATTKPAPIAQHTPGKYIPATTQQALDAIDHARRFAADVSEKTGVKFTEVDSDHFMIFTDWDARDHAFLKTNFEDAYALVSKVFDIPPRENVFIGKLPVFMYDRRESFFTHARQVDDLVDVSQVAGYYAGHRGGTGHMVMWKPVADANVSLQQAKLRWARTLLHEFVHAFVARYRNNRANIPVWLNEGTAELIADEKFPYPYGRTVAREYVMRNMDVRGVFDDSTFKSPEMYPIMMSMVESLVKKDRQAYISMFDAIKDGTPAEDALRKFYGIDYDGLDRLWRAYAVTK